MHTLVELFSPPKSRSGIVIRPKSCSLLFLESTSQHDVDASMVKRGLFELYDRCSYVMYMSCTHPKQVKHRSSILFGGKYISFNMHYRKMQKK